MKVSNGDIYNAKEPLETLLKLSLPIKASLTVARFAKKLNAELQSIEEVRMGLIRKYGKESSDGQQVMVEKDSKKYPEFMAEYVELMGQETEFIADKITLPATVSGRPLELEPSILMALEKFLEIEDESDKPAKA